MEKILQLSGKICFAPLKVLPYMVCSCKLLDYILILKICDCLSIRSLHFQFWSFNYLYDIRKSATPSNLER